MSTNNSIPTPLPKYIYKILSPSPAPPSPLPTSLPISALDQRDGFLHMSTSRQILGTLKNFFAQDSHVWILRVKYEVVASRIKWEDSKGKGPDEVGGCWDIEGEAGFFPHIYGEGMRLGNQEVESVGKWERGADGWTAEQWPFKEDRPHT